MRDTVRYALPLRPARRARAPRCWCARDLERIFDFRREAVPRAAHLTVSVPSMPAASVAGDRAVELYVPGLRSAVTGRLAACRRSCRRRRRRCPRSRPRAATLGRVVDMSIVTLPALAVSVACRTSARRRSARELERLAAAAGRERARASRSPWASLASRVELRRRCPPQPASASSRRWRAVSRVIRRHAISFRQNSRPVQDVARGSRARALVTTRIASYSPDARRGREPHVTRGRGRRRGTCPRSRSSRARSQQHLVDDARGPAEPVAPTAARSVPPCTRSSASAARAAGAAAPAAARSAYLRGRRAAVVAASPSAITSAATAATSGAGDGDARRAPREPRQRGGAGARPRRAARSRATRSSSALLDAGRERLGRARAIGAARSSSARQPGERGVLGGARRAAREVRAHGVAPRRARARRARSRRASRAARGRSAVIGPPSPRARAAASAARTRCGS